MSKKSIPLPIERLGELLELSETSPTGLRWKIGGSGRKGKGSVAGCLARTSNNQRKNRYLVCIEGRLYKAHRVIYAMYHGFDPGEMQIDHINGDGTDNRIENLRLATSQQNNRNRGMAINNTSGARGVCWHYLKQKWMASIMINGRNRNLGYYKSFEDAKERRRQAEIAAFGDFSPLTTRGLL